jgi:predicted MFS family arabinose efflux permease
MLHRALNATGARQALRSRPFRWYLIERIVGAFTWAMRSVARGWLVYSLTGSVLALASVEAVRAIVGIFLSPVAGVMTDRLEKRLVMMGARIILVFVNLALAALVWLGVLQMWQIIVATIIEGIAFAAIDPVIQSIIPELVDRDALLSATSTTFVVEGVFNIMGAFAAGLIIKSIGVGGVFFINAMLFVVAAYSLLQIPGGIIGHRGPGSLRRDMAAALRYLRASPLLIGLLGLAFARLLFLQPYSAFLPAFSSQNLGFDAAGLGLLVSVGGIGALAGSLLIAAAGDRGHKGKLLLAAGSAAAAAVLTLMLTPAMFSPFILVALIGGFSNTAEVFTRTLVQSLCDASYRGRVASVAMEFTYLVSLCVIPAGALADTYGVPLIIGSLAALVLIIQIAAAILMPDVRKLD